MDSDSVQDKAVDDTVKENSDCRVEQAPDDTANEQVHSKALSDSQDEQIDSEVKKSACSMEAETVISQSNCRDYQKENPSNNDIAMLESSTSSSAPREGTAEETLKQKHDEQPLVGILAANSPVSTTTDENRGEEGLEKNAGLTNAGFEETNEKGISAEVENASATSVVPPDGSGLNESHDVEASTCFESSADRLDIEARTESQDEAVDTATESETLYEETEEFSEEFEETSDLAEYDVEMPSLRPREVPQAPRNFTSFIMDEHDDCELFIDFNKDAEIRYPVSSSVRDQEFFDQDFQNVYQSTRESEALELPRETLIERILEMREKVKVLHDRLAEREERDPRNILTKLHAALLELQEENKKLRNRLGPCKIHGKGSQHDSQARVDSSSE